ncbi:hypothetical protein TNIN_166861 [Trichonephila inaurata madagascariensis]|uniref:Uncharacterized protein n=1 Tax=Trichonephila inaurata madagascariensis TaxID=2747483 RepID=A0A8X6M8U6_9ARAC|nr:hypothetical protein TNIN_166861 [Trichonephila inaurata madagascariensis]
MLLVSLRSGSSADNLRFFPLKGYKSYSLGRSRQIASGIIIFVKNNLTVEPLLKHAMTTSDSLEVIELRAPAGADHKIPSVIISNPEETHAPRVTRWNLKKANWEKYASLTNTLLGNCLLDLNNDEALDIIITTILACTHVCIPKGHIINGKPFWEDKLQTLKEEKDLARDRADSSDLEDCLSLRKKQAILKKEILNAKRASFNKFL